jgi:DNA recombination protein RmuC
VTVPKKNQTALHLVFLLMLQSASARWLHNARRPKSCYNRTMNVILVVLGVINLAGLLYVISRLQQKTGLDKPLREEFAQNRKEMAEATKDLRVELTNNLGLTRDSIEKRVEQLRDKNDEKLEHIRKTVETRLEALQKDNSDKLEKMRQTVDEKLQSTLEKRLGESFKLVSERLEHVQRGLGEMQTLATGVGDLKRVLGNIKTRGTWGEIQLESLLDQIMTAEQFERNVQIKKGSLERADFAIRIPAKDDENGVILLPIDAKFPLEDYQRLVTASEAGDVEAIALSAKALEARIKEEARKIHDKYIDPPATTDFGILYLPIEGLYAEVVQRPALVDALQRTYRVSVAGPHTIAALLNSLQMGFRTLTIQKRTSEVWQVLGTVKTEFGRFGDLLDRTKKKLQEATNNIDDASVRSRSIERQLGKVQQLADKTETSPPEVISLPLGETESTK